MLDDSVPYKTQFIEELDDIVSICISSDADNVKLERFVFWVAFTVRKLSEASKLSDELESEPVVIDRYQRNNTDGCYDNLNWFKIETFYRLGTSEELTIAPIWLCHQLIHSFVFLPALYDDGRVRNIFFNSDRTKNEWLFSIMWDEFCHLVRMVAADDIVSAYQDRRAGIVRKSREYRH